MVAALIPNGKKIALIEKHSFENVKMQQAIIICTGES